MVKVDNAGGNGKSRKASLVASLGHETTMKMHPKVASVFSLTPQTLIAIGSAGTALCLSEPPEGFPVDGSPATASFRGYKATGISPVEIGTLHGQGEACGLPEFDACLFVSPRGETVSVLPLSKALSSGKVARVEVCLNRDGNKRKVTVFAPKGWNTGAKVPQFMASADVLAGRIEKHAIPDGRNASYTGKVLPLSFLSTTAPKPTPAVKPTPSPSKAGVKPTTVPAKSPTKPTPAGKASK